MSCPSVADPSTPGASHRGCAYTDEASQGLQQEICRFYFKRIRLEYGTKLNILQFNEIRLSKIIKISFKIISCRRLIFPNPYSCIMQMKFELYIKYWNTVLQLLTNDKVSKNFQRKNLKQRQLEIKKNLTRNPTVRRRPMGGGRIISAPAPSSRLAN